MNNTSPLGDDRHIRVYVSSNFRDMHAERDILKNRVFPKIRELCEKRAVTLTEVDLRQGISDEANAEGKVLQLFSEAIDRCRPFFIGLLGENYGWVPESIPAELLEREPWLRECRDRSVIELETLHVLNNLEMGSQDLFYFRDPTWIEKLPPDAPRWDFVSDDAASAYKLVQLKQRIRGSGFPVRENYLTPEALGELVLADFTRVVDRLFPMDSRPDPLILSKEAETLTTRGDLDGAMALLKEQERMCRQWGDLNCLAITLSNQANILSQRGDLDGAIALIREQERICRQLGDPIGLSISLNNQANVLSARGDLDVAMTLREEAERISRQALAASEQVLGLEHPDNLAILNNLATLLVNKGDYAGAEPLYRRVLQVNEQMFGPEHARTQVTRENIARLTARIICEQVREQAMCVEGEQILESGDVVITLSEVDKLPNKVIGAKHERGTAKVPTSRIDKVGFSVASPPGAQPSQQFIVDVWAHLERQLAEVERRVQQAHPQTDSLPVIRPKGPFKIERGTTLFVRLKFEDLQVEPPEDVILWEGEIGNASFEVAIPGETPEGVKCGLVTVHWEGGLQIARVPLHILVARKCVPAAPTTQPLLLIRKAFASYASPDRNEVIGRIQEMQKIAPDLDVFLDVVKLRSGEDWEKRLWRIIPESDVFYLFWSAAAKASPWVEKEWRCALSSRGEEFIDPVPLVSPDEVRPPDELSKKHFNDWILAYRHKMPI